MPNDWNSRDCWPDPRREQPHVLPTRPCETLHAPREIGSQVTIFTRQGVHLIHVSYRVRLSTYLHVVL